MTVSNENNKTYTVGNGVTTAFPFNNVLFDETALTVVLVDNSVTPPTDTLQVLTTDYTVAIAGDNSSATVTMLTAPAATETLVIYRDQPDTQTTSYPEGGQFPAASHEDALDRGALQSQTQEELINRSLRLPATQQTTGGAAFDGEMNKPTATKTMVGWNATDMTMEMVNGIDDKTTLSTPAATDGFLVSDASESGTLKKVLYQSIQIGDAVIAGNFALDGYDDGVDYTSGTTTQLTLGADPGSENNTQIYFDGVYQEKDTYSISGAVVTFDAAIPLGTNRVECVRGGVADIGAPSDGTVTTDKLANNAVTSAKILDGTIATADLADESVTNAKLAHVATDTFKGRTTAGTGDVEDLSATQARTILNVEDGADVTDATNVNAAGATMNTDTDVSGTSWFLDEDDMSSDSATKVPSQQSVKAYTEINPGRAPDIIVREEQASGTNGGGSSAGANVRGLNNEVRDINSDCALSSSRVTLTAGSYYIEFYGVAYQAASHQTYLYNYTDTSIFTDVIGSKEYAIASNSVCTKSSGSGVFTVAASKELELRHYFQSAKALDGLGVGLNTGVKNVYAEIKLWRLS